MPVINEAPSSLANNSAIAVGFALGVALFVVVGKVCGDADDDGGDETRSRLRTVSSANSVCSEAGHAPKSKLGMMKDSMCEADYEVVSEAPRFPRYPTTMVQSASSESVYVSMYEERRAGALQGCGSPGVPRRGRRCSPCWSTRSATASSSASPRRRARTRD